MDAWSSALERKEVLLVDALSKTKKLQIPPSKNVHSLIFPDREADQSMRFMEFGSPDTMIVPFSSNKVLGILGSAVGEDSSKRFPSTYTVPSSSFSEELKSGPRLSSSLNDLVGLREAKNSRSSRERSMASSARFLLPAKRALAANLNSQIPPVCQVYGCSKDLSSSKYYYKRHKVCEVHSKTTKVIVNGIEQRFCQQCSRFHLLAEFDDGKRSCRKRLAGHNQRRRKPQLDILSVKPHELLQFYQGARLLGSSLAKRSSFVLPDIFPGFGRVNHRKPIKSELEQICNPQSTPPVKNGLPCPKSFLPLHGMREQYLSGTFSSDSAYPLFDTTSSTVQELSGVSSSSDALSLLSDQLGDLSSHSTGVLKANPLIIQGAATHASFQPLGTSIVDEIVPNHLYSSWMNSVEVALAGPSFILDSPATVQSKFGRDGILQRSDTNEQTVDLFQLSMHLLRVEQRRNTCN